MKRFRVGAGALPTLALATLATLAAGPAHAQGTLTMNGQVVSPDLHSVGGSAFVRLADIAKALGMVIVKRPGGYDLQKPGGANQVGDTQGKVGDVLFNGQWRFQVLGVTTPDSYTTKTPDLDLRGISGIRYDETTRVLSAAPGNTLVVVQCRVTNGQKTTQTFWLGHNDVHNALTDTQGESYPPFGYDLVGAPSESKPLLPGAGTTFPIFFAVPVGTPFHDLIFTLRDNDFSDKAVITDVRVSLTDAPP